ncbi:unnamed protein product [Cyclocybe aegerita]|uniref:Uncharacterized protein n=1 Tax=Cyclocybe aegerita TaxID=1973307 RepID=A0A8S0W6V7_CYCAE|nr:unnamed protein product [Cyclocybe aegerita]
MTNFLKAYTDLTPSSSRTKFSDVSNSIINAPPFSFDKASRTSLINAILQDLKNSGPKEKLTSKDAAQALLAVKTLGKDPSGSAYIASSANLSTLLSFAATFKDDPDASSEALRCIANALLLIENARSTFIEKEVNGAELCLTMLEKSTSPDHIFILSRILFLATAAGTSHIETMLEGKYHGRTVVEILTAKLDLMTISIRNGTPTAKEALTDLLKFVFNLLLHYPKLVDCEPQHSDTYDDEKVMADYWSSKLDGLLPPLLRVFLNLPSTSPGPIAAPLTHVIHSLITVPLTPSLKPVWFGPPTSTSSRNSANNSPKARTPQLSDSTPGSRCDSPTPSNPSSPKPSPLDRALSVLAAGRRSLSLSRTSSPSTSTPGDVLQRAYDLVESAFSHYFPGTVEPDDAEVRERAKAECSDTLDDSLSPIVVLVTRICIADETSRVRVRQWLIPDDLDRTSPLEQRSDLLGKCLRILGSVYHSRLKDSVGEMLFAIADSNATTLSALVGYGNVAGFLFHKGVVSAPVQPSSDTNVPLTTPSGDAINPITGIKEQPKSNLPEMDDEEKEREMEKLFVLFDRLEKTGALPADQNPMRKVVQKSMGG